MKPLIRMLRLLALSSTSLLIIAACETGETTSRNGARHTTPGASGRRVQPQLTYLLLAAIRTRDKPERQAGAAGQGFRSKGCRGCFAPPNCALVNG